MKKLLDKIKAKKIARMGLLMSVVAAILAVGAFADGPSAIESAVTTALATTQSDALSLIAGVLPYALAIVGAVLVVTIGIRVFKKISGR